MLKMEKYISEYLPINESHLEAMAGERVVIFGAAGTIGSGLVFELAKLEPEEILLIDNNETAMFYILNSSVLKNVNYDYKICDIRNTRKINYIIKKFRPTIVFNAAAYKHVSLVENNVDEGLSVNVLGTYNIIKACDDNNVRRLVHISTDKAVNVSNFMGMTKRLTELLCQNYPTNQLIISVVRFGNVWGSNGSLIQILEHKIRNNEDVFITNKKCTRYFMSIEKAAKLVIFTSCIPAKKVNIFVLDMGDPVNIYDLTKQIIEGENANIKIHLTKLTQGEKINETLFYKKLKFNFDGVFIDENFVEVNIDQMIDKVKKIIQNFGLTKYDNPVDLLNYLVTSKDNRNN